MAPICSVFETCMPAPRKALPHMVLLKGPLQHWSTAWLVSSLGLASRAAALVSLQAAEQHSLFAHRTWRSTACVLKGVFHFYLRWWTSKRGPTWAYIGTLLLLGV